MKKHLIVIVAAAAAVLLFAGAFAVKILNSDGDADTDTDKLTVTAVSYSKGGSMNGGHISIEAERKEETNTVKVRISRQEFWNTPVEVSDYTASPELLDKMAEIIAENSLDETAARPDSGFYVKDAPTEHMTVRLADDTVFALRSEQDLTAGERAAWDEIIELFLSREYMIED